MFAYPIRTHRFWCPKPQIKWTNSHYDGRHRFHHAREMPTYRFDLGSRVDKLMLELSFSWEARDDFRLSSAHVALLIQSSQTIILVVKRCVVLCVVLGFNDAAWSLVHRWVLRWGLTLPFWWALQGFPPPHWPEEPADIPEVSPGCSSAVCLGSPCWSGTNYPAGVTQGGIPH